MRKRPTDAVAQWFRDRYGYRPCRARVCPRVVAGNRCFVGYPQREVCLCQRHHRLLDHGRAWIDTDGRHVVTGEPYHVADDELAALVADAESLGLTVNIAPFSPWFPGRTTLVRITQKDPGSPGVQSGTRPDRRPM